MAVIKQNSMPFKPYARLMNILGDQLITDKIVAVIEVLKNCYDADSPSAEVRFGNLDKIDLNDLPLDEQAYIEISDTGCGMSLEKIQNVWLRPATPDKLKKKSQQLIRTPKGRVVQGEKGIGRFAIHKLGEKIELYTKAEGESEVKLVMDFSDYDPDNINLFNQNTSYKLLEEVNNTWYENFPPERVNTPSGTIIRIYNLREHWTKSDFKNLYKSIQRLIPPFDKNADTLGIKIKRDFEVTMYVDDKQYVSEDVMTFDDVIERAQFTIIGAVDEKANIKFDYNTSIYHREIHDEFNLFDSDETSKRNYNLTGIKEILKTGRKPECGEFCFTFYAFDLKKPDRTILNEDLKRFIKENFVYVLRDGLRVYPYGEPGVDWLDLDKKRSTIKAGQFISYNDLTGFVYITQEHNPKLKDASNRQGIVNSDGAYDDFRNIVTAVTEIFNSEIKIDKIKSEIKRQERFNQAKSVLDNSFEALNKALLKSDNQSTLLVAQQFINVYKNHLSVIEDRMKTVEDLAGLGMAVEKSSHDALRVLSLMSINIKNVIASINRNGCEKQDVISFLTDMDDNLRLVYEDLQLIQPLFKIQRKTTENVSVKDCIKTVLRYFRYEIQNKIDTNIDNISEDLYIETNKGIILQILINLIDNAIYWINESKNSPRQLFFRLNSSEQTLIVSDSGNGIREEIVPLIFDEFVSMKSNGRGLGLYIVRELLYRINADIAVLENPADKILSGANFIIKFKNEEEN